jgi:hypothetical protein
MKDSTGSLIEKREHTALLSFVKRGKIQKSRFNSRCSTNGEEM